MSLLMDALRRAEADKKEQAARAARTGDDIELSLEDDVEATRIGPIEDDVPPPRVPLGASELALEPLEVSVAKLRASRAAASAEGGLLGRGGLADRRDPGSTLPSARSLEREINGLLEGGLDERPPEPPLEDTNAHTAATPQTVFQGGERRMRFGRMLGIGGALLVVGVLGLLGLGVYFITLSPAPTNMPSPTVASGVEKPDVSKLPEVPPGDSPLPPVNAADALRRSPPVAIVAPPAAEGPGEQPAVPAGQEVGPAAGGTSGSAAGPAEAGAAQIAALQAAAARTAARQAASAPPHVAAGPTPSTLRAPSPAPDRATRSTTPQAAAAEDMASGTVRIARAPAARDEDAPIAQAYAALKAGDSGRAELLYRRALMLEPERREALLGLAALAQRRGDVTTAYAQYRAVLARYPDDPAATAGVLALTAADGADAAARLRLLLDRNPEAAYLHAALGHHLAREARWADAQQAYFDAVRLDPNNADFAYDLAVSLDHLGQARAALDYYQKALNLAVRGPVSFDTTGVQTRIQALAPTVPVE